jgi:hypothetical protein
MKPIQIISQDVFDKVRSRFSNLEMGDETGAVTIDPAEARFFDFDFIHEGNNLGRVSISLNDLGSLKVYYSQGITENQDDPLKQTWYDFLKEMRFFAMRRLLRFDTRDIAKNNLDKNDFQHLAATQGPKEEEPMNTVNESRWNHKSSRKTSRAVQGRTEVIVRHHKPVDEDFAGSRSQRKNIKAIFIQNRDGERFKYPFIHPAGAFAMAQHVDHGGIPHDPAGRAIIKMSEEIAQLGEFQRKVQHQTLHDDATGITERAVGRLTELKDKIAAIGKRQYYENWLAEFNEQEQLDDSMMELDAVTMEDYKSKFTQKNFQEELTQYFPLIHRIMAETSKIELEDLVSEDDTEDEEDDKEVKESIFKEFEDWADATERGELTDDQVEAIKQALEQLPEPLQLGPNGETAINFFSELGLDDEELNQNFEDEARIDSSADPMEDVFVPWAKENQPSLLDKLGINYTDKEGESPEPAAAAGAEQPAPAPAAPPAPEPGTEQPTAEMTQPEGRGTATVHGIMSAENDEGVWTNSTMTAESRSGMVQKIAEIVKSRFNEDNPDVGAFRDPENIATEVKKEISEKYGDEMGERAREMAEQFMEKLTRRWAKKHGKVNDLDGLARIKELSGMPAEPEMEEGAMSDRDIDFQNDLPEMIAALKSKRVNAGDMRRQFGSSWKHLVGMTPAFAGKNPSRSEILKTAMEMQSESEPEDPYTDDYAPGHGDGAADDMDSAFNQARERGEMESMLKLAGLK